MEHRARQEEERRREKEQARWHAQLAAIMGFLGEGDARAVRGVVAKGG